MHERHREPPESQRAFRYWVEIRDLGDGSVRTLPLHAMRLVHLGRKRSDPAQPVEHHVDKDHADQPCRRCASNSSGVINDSALPACSSNPAIRRRRL